MCGRFTLIKNKSEVRNYLFSKFSIKNLPDNILIPNYNVAPTNNVLVIIKEKDYCEGAAFLWSYKPKSWENAPLIINIRSESLLTNKLYEKDFKSNRCLIVADSFYEWDKEGEPFRIHLNDNLFCMAGIYHLSSDENNDLVPTVAIITKESDLNFSEIHHRIPVILDDSDLVSWLDEKASSERLINMINSTKRELTIYPVSKKVNNYKNNDSSLIKEIKKKMTLFDL